MHMILWSFFFNFLIKLYVIQSFEYNIWNTKKKGPALVWSFIFQNGRSMVKYRKSQHSHPHHLLCVFVCVCASVVITSSTRRKKPSGFGSFWRHLIKSAASATTITTTTTYQTLEMQKSMCCTIDTHTVAYAIWLMLFSVRVCVC